jgi:hypothetical protein
MVSAGDPNLVERKISARTKITTLFFAVKGVTPLTTLVRIRI